MSTDTTEVIVYWAQKSLWCTKDLAIKVLDLAHAPLAPTYKIKHIENLQSSWVGDKVLGRATLTREEYAEQCKALVTLPVWVTEAGAGNRSLLSYIKKCHPCNNKARRFFKVNRVIRTQDETDSFIQYKQHPWAHTCAVGAVGSCLNSYFSIIRPPLPKVWPGNLVHVTNIHAQLLN